MTSIAARLFKNGQSQAVRIPRIFQFEGIDEVLIRREGDACHFDKVPDLRLENWV